jgi:cysteinyl-tRNA synthetase
MSTKYLGQVFDIHGGGMDLQFPHHECEIAQSTAANGKESVRYWMHNNMITINGQKMARSLGNFITLDELFSGTHELLEQAYSPMTIRFFILQAHYRSTIDFSNEALQAAGTGYQKLMRCRSAASKVKASVASTVDIATLKTKCYEALDDDLNTPVLLSHLFEGVRIINSAAEGGEKLTENDLSMLTGMLDEFTFNILGLKEETAGDSKLSSGLISILVGLRQEAKAKKDWELSDRIRKQLKDAGVILKDTKDGVEWELE